ncbi:MAG: YdcF family protein [Mycobacteriales bacterium]
MTTTVAIPDRIRVDVELLWDYHDLRHEPQPCDVAIGLGGRDLRVAIHATELYRHGAFPLIVFSGANARTTAEHLRQGEAVRYRVEAIKLGVPADAILVEPYATNTGQNIEFTRKLLEAHGVTVDSVILISRPYQQRRAYATCKQLWPQVQVTCTSPRLSLDDYVTSVGDSKRVIDMVVGETQRVIEYPKRGFGIPQPMPEHVKQAFHRLVSAGYTSRLIHPVSE